MSNDAKKLGGYFPRRYLITSYRPTVMYSLPHQGVKLADKIEKVVASEDLTQTDATLSEELKKALLNSKPKNG
jgi:hypothetical protein